MIKGKKIFVVLPAFNAEKTLEKTVADLPAGFIDEIVLVDDASRDRTVEVAQKLGLKTFVHRQNLGYGGNQKTCYREALRLGADVIVMVHPDHQYDPKFVPELIRPIIDNEVEAVFGSRMMIRGEARKGGMPAWKYWANIFLTKIENFVLGLNLTEYHSGFRAYSAKALKSLPLELNSNNFVFDTEIIVQLMIHNFKIKEIPISTRYFKEASTIGLIASLKYGLNILLVLLKYELQKYQFKNYNQFSSTRS